jgi:hypothetical protein
MTEQSREPAPLLHPLRDRLLALVGRGAGEPLSDDDCGALALEVNEHQYHCNDPYRAACERRGATPEKVRHWAEVPAVPTDAFRSAALVCGDPAHAAAAFRTSGTTAGAERRGTHYFPDLALYDAALAAGFRAHLLPDGARLPILALLPSPTDAPDSSLSHMLGEGVREMGAEGSRFFVNADGLQVEQTIRALHAATDAGEAVLVAGTSFAFVHLIDALRARGERIVLPPGSRGMDTGGFKGRSRTVERGELYAELTEVLGIGAEWWVNEYGMTEMSSQFYDGRAGTAGEVAGRIHRGPPWVRTRAYDPETLAPVQEGEVGVLRHWDLANLDSVMALQTADLGRVVPGGFQILGRAQGAEARGCSIAMDELLSALAERGRPR